MAEQRETPPATFGARQAQPVDGFLDVVAQIDVDRLMDRFQSPVATEFNKSREQVAKIAAAFFLGEGRPVLEWLCDITIRRPHIMPFLGPEAAFFAAHREGQNSAIWQIIAAIAEGREETPPVREGV